MTMRQMKPIKHEHMNVPTHVEPNAEVALRALLAHDLTAFTQFAFGVVRPEVEFKPNWHLEAITHKLSQVAAGLIRRLIITLPPRSLKSLCASVALPAWFLGHSPWSAWSWFPIPIFLRAPTPVTSAAW